MSSRRRSFPWGWIFLIVLLGAGFFAWRWYEGRSKETAIEYKTAPVARADVTQAVTANGQINAVKNVAVGSQVSGIITDIKVDFNSRVTNGQVIAQIDPSTYQQNITQAEAELSNAAAGLELAQVNWKRAQVLRTNNLIPEADYDQALANLHQGEAVVKTRQASLNKAKVDLERATIYAPIDGVVISRVVDVGQTVAASFNAPTLFTIANDLRQMRIEAMVSEADVGGVEEGQQVTFTVDAFPGRKFRGEVTQVRYAPVTNQNVVNYTTVVDVNNADLKLRPGMTANASILIADHKNVLRIPNSALRFRPPPGAAVEGETNAPAKEKVEIATSGPFAGLPIPPWQAKGERRRPTDEERTAYEASLTPEQKQKYQEIIAAMRARFAQREAGGEGGSERPRRSEPAGPRTQTVYLMQKENVADGKSRDVLKPVTIKVGISDGSNTEVLEGLKEGDIVVTGTVSSAAEASGPVTPFGNPFGGPRRR
jgi:HlyD family secretion protein